MNITVQGHTGWVSYPVNIFRSRLPHSTVHLLANLLTHAEGFHASYSTISKQTGMAKGTISTALKNLQALGVVTISKESPQGDRWQRNHFVFHVDRLWQLTPEVVEERLGSGVSGSKIEPDKNCTGSKIEPGSGSKIEPTPVQKLNTKKDQGSTSTKEDQSIAHSRKNWFDDFWEVVPRKTGKGKAREAWKRALKKADAETIIEGMIRYRDDPNREDEFTKHPATWLNGECWDDDPLPARGSARQSETRPASFLDVLRESWEQTGVESPPALQSDEQAPFWPPLEP
ncbi:helix-turn-helix domain-containing protein [Corynebacterium phocae]|uniref:helix-turn-helix domain-containing protein n=1 Tax=Corynebacterium phocae TaxID=161895 RepID=UPI000951CB15|nr:helix-turn-helix domain-containing protein [Corynebacterium phocae]KAA8723240.1 helix-turn-helix domain-containing protein [Corynebacterium phocae]